MGQPHFIHVQENKSHNFQFSEPPRNWGIFELQEKEKGQEKKIKNK